MSEEEKLDFGARRKDVGAQLFKAGRFQLAMERYKKVALGTQGGVLEGSYLTGQT